MASHSEFATHLRSVAESIEDARRGSGERTRLMLLASAASLLESTTFQDLRISDIREPVGASQGTVYIYFKSKLELIRDLLSAFIDHEIETIPDIAKGEHIFDYTLRYFRWYERSFRHNRGIMRCLVRMSDESPEIAAIWMKRSRAIVSQIVKILANQAALSKQDKAILSQQVYAIGSMLDQTLFARYSIHAAANSGAPNDAEFLTEMHAIMAYRALFGKDPPASKVQKARRLLSLTGSLRP